MADPQPAAREARRWMAQAQIDLDDAAASAEGGRHALACFLCHQAAEKAVTAFLYSRGVDLVWGHALTDLCEDAMALDSSFNLLKSSAAQLDRHFLGARYPSTLPGGVPGEVYDSDDSSRAIEIASHALAFVTMRLDDPPSDG